jgi:hypothetical protein
MVDELIGHGSGAKDVMHIVWELGWRQVVVFGCVQTKNSIVCIVDFM